MDDQGHDITIKEIMMEITLSAGTVIEILNINIAAGSVDWKRQTGYTGVCLSYIQITDLATAETEIKAVLEGELGISQ